MKKYLLILTILSVLSAGLFAINMTRTLYVPLKNSDNSVITTTTGLTFTATISNGSVNTLTQASTGCGFQLINGTQNAKIQLGNFSIQWATGNIVTIHVTRSLPAVPAAGMLDNITLPAGTGAIAWATPVLLVPTGGFSEGGIVIAPEAGVTYTPAIVTDFLPGYVSPDGTVMIITNVFSTGKGKSAHIVTIPPGTWFILAYYGGVWHTAADFPAINPPLTTTTISYPDGVPVTLMFTTDPIVGHTLPVELSSFTAVLTAEYFVNLTWVTQSETEVLGFNVLRSETADATTAVRINASVIGATNTSEEHTYNMLDTEVTTGDTYYYWLENVDMGGVSTLHGPQSVTVTGNPVPVLPEISMLNNSYPNPFRAGTTTNINVSIKAGETGTVTVYNILGQNVKSFKVNEGIHTLKWDGKGCGSGIYFYRLTTPTTNATKKLVIVK